MKASTKRRRDTARMLVSSEGLDERIRVHRELFPEASVDMSELRKDAERDSKDYFTGKLHPQRRRPLHALRGRALKRRVAYFDRKILPGRFWSDYVTVAERDLIEKKAPWLCTPRQFRQAARARRFRP